MRWRPILERLDRDLATGIRRSALVRARVEAELDRLQHTMSDLETIIGEGGDDDGLGRPEPA